MKKLIVGLLLLCCMTLGAFALDGSSIRAKLDSDTAVSYKSFSANDLASTSSLNMYISGAQTQGSLIAIFPKERLSISWDSKGNNYGTTLISDNEYYSQFKANAKVQSGVTATYKTAYIVYYKQANYVYVYGDNFVFGTDIVLK